MNVFILHTDKSKSASALVDRHVNKMTLEATQICNTALYLNDLEHLTFYQKTHEDHPWVKYAASNFSRWAFVYQNIKAIGDEYSSRYGGTHASHQKALDNWESEEVMEELYDTLGPGSLFPFPQTMPDTYKEENYVEAYRSYYKYDKLTKPWAFYRHSEPPDWILEGTPRERW